VIASHCRTGRRSKTHTHRSLPVLLSRAEKSGAPSCLQAGISPFEDE
jgi:hypothetical protein